MSWFKKIARNWGQIPFADPTENWEAVNDPYARYNIENPRRSKKKDMTQDSLGMGSSSHNSDEVAGQDNASDVNSLSSFHNIDSIMYNGEITDESPSGGNPQSRNEFTGGPSIGDSPTSLGMEDDALGSYILRHSPDEDTAGERSYENFINFQKRKPLRRASVNGFNINVI